MPGITAFITRNRGATDPSVIGQRMLGAMRRESWHESGSHAVPECGLGAGWVVDADSPCREQPVWSESGTLCLILVGEFPGEDEPAQRLLDGCGKHGITASLARLNGRFCGVLADLGLRRVHVFNDRFGLNRLYVHQSPNGLYFSSQAKAILACVPETRGFDPVGLAEFFACGCPLQDRSLFQGVGLLPAGSLWTIAGDRGVEMRRYFDPAEWEQRPTLGAADYQSRLQEVFGHAVRRCFADRRPAALSLTGGVDSRMIVAALGEAPPRIPCYSFRGPMRECEDARIARKVAGACGWDFHPITLDGDFLGSFHDLAAETIHASDGAMDVSGAAELFVNRKARGIAPVRVTGNYGGEILRSKVAFRPSVPRHPVLEPAFTGLVAAAATTYAAELAGRRLSFIAFKQVPWHHFCRFSVEQSQVAVRSPFLDNELLELAYQAPPELRTSPLPAWRLIRAGNRLLAGIPTDRGVAYPPGGLASRVRRWWSGLLAKAEYAFDYGMPDPIATTERLVASLRVERLFLGRQKFCHFRTWYRNELADTVRTTLLDPSVLRLPFLDRQGVERLAVGHTEGQLNGTTEIHKLLTVGLIDRLLLHPPCHSSS